jgi:ATP-binding cassette subfamily F protein 3
MLASNYDKNIEMLLFKAYNNKKEELEKLLFDWEVVQEEIDNL